MKSPIILLSLLLITLPSWFKELTKDRTILFSSNSYYKCDLDGDKINDLAVWDKSTSTLYYELSALRKFYSRKFFDTEVKYEPVFADYDGDGVTDFAFFQPETGHWITYLTTAGEIPRKEFLGGIGDIPVPTNLDGNSSYEKGIWRPNAAAWVVYDVDDKGTIIPKLFREGNYQDSPVSADFDGDGKSDLTVWRPDDGTWHIVKSKDNLSYQTSAHIQHGQEWDILVPNDYDADGKCDLAFFRPGENKWHIKYSGKNSIGKIRFGRKNDIPLSLDLTNDNIPELITWNPNLLEWKIFNITTRQVSSLKWNVPKGCLPASTILQKFE